MAFRDRFSKRLVERFASKVGTTNIYGEEYWRGDKVYAVSGEAYFYEAYKILKGSKSRYIDDYIHKIWYLLGQRAPTLTLAR